MLAYRLEDCCVSITGSIAEAMRSLEKSGVEIVLVMDRDGVMAGVMTDGDVRRALLRGASLEVSLEPYIQRKFISVPPDLGRADVLDLMKARTIEQIPVVDQNGRLLGLHLLRELIGAVDRPNWAVIMAGGKGTRLLPITERIPKPMIRVAGRPILERLVLHLTGYGIRRIFISINYLGHVVESHFGDGSSLGCHIEYLREQQPLGTGGALSLLPPVPTTPVLVVNGDVVTQADVGAMLNFHHQGGYVATLGVREYLHVVPFGCLETTNGRVIRLEEKPALRRLINAGIYVLNPELIPRVPRDTEFPLTSLLEECLRLGQPVGAYEVEDDWIDVGQREQLKLAREGSV